MTAGSKSEVSNLSRSMNAWIGTVSPDWRM